MMKYYKGYFSKKLIEGLFQDRDANLSNDNAEDSHFTYKDTVRLDWHDNLVPSLGVRMKLAEKLSENHRGLLFVFDCVEMEED